MARDLVIGRGQRIKVSVTFEAAWENQVVIEDKASGQRLFKTSSAYDETRVWTSPRNNSSRSIVYKLYGQHKESGPSTEKPWKNSAESVEVDTPQELIVGYDDGAHGTNEPDWNDARVTVTWE